MLRSFGQHGFTANRSICSEHLVISIRENNIIRAVHCLSKKCCSAAAHEKHVFDLANFLAWE